MITLLSSQNVNDNVIAQTEDKVDFIAQPDNNVTDILLDDKHCHELFCVNHLTGCNIDVSISVDDNIVLYTCF
jgi:hypothetical protein